MPPIASPSTGASPAKAKAVQADSGNKWGCPERVAFYFIITPAKVYRGYPPLRRIGSVPSTLGGPGMPGP